MTYILKWNPDISSINLTEWEYWIQHFPFIKPNWSVYEHENSEYGDEFYLVKVGSGKTGVVMKGIFSSLPYRAQDWSGKGRKVFYRDLWIAHIMHPDKDPIIPTSALNDAIPDFDWEKGHSGICLNEDDATAMEKLWNEFAKKNADFLQKQEELKRYVIEPSALAKIKGSKLWEKKVCPEYAGTDDIYKDCATHDCVNLKFAHDYNTHCFRLDVCFCSVVLKIFCKGLCRLKMDMDNNSCFMSDFSISEAGPDYLHLSSNGIELWCESIEFREVTEYEKEFVPVCI